MNTSHASGKNETPTPARQSLAKTKSQDGKRKKGKPCGAKTKQCRCGHHQREHAGRNGTCWQCEDRCLEYRAKLCSQTITSKTNGRCKMHGGTQPRGIASPNWKHGRHALGIKNSELRNGFLSALSDPTLTTLQSSMAIQQAFLGNQLARLKDGKQPTKGQRNEILRIISEYRITAEAHARMEQRRGGFIVRASFGAFARSVVELFREVAVLADGKPDIPKLRMIDDRIRTAAKQIELVGGDPMEGEVIDDKQHDD